MTYDASKHLVRGPADLLDRLHALHENAAVAWDRDVATALGEHVIIATSTDPGAISLGILGYAVDLDGRIFRLVRADDDPLEIRWVRWSAQDRSLQFQGKKAPAP